MINESETKKCGRDVNAQELREVFDGLAHVIRQAYNARVMRGSDGIIRGDVDHNIEIASNGLMFVVMARGEYYVNSANSVTLIDSEVPATFSIVARSGAGKALLEAVTAVCMPVLEWYNKELLSVIGSYNEDLGD